MAENYEIEFDTNQNIYVENSLRKSKVYFSIPDNGVNEETGILLLISGFGASSCSNVYKKMRNNFADEYNLITIQCDYFGNEFMQTSKDSDIKIPPIKKEELACKFSDYELSKIYENNNFNQKAFLQFSDKYNMQLGSYEDLSKENINNFNEMGIIQAVDNITALLYTISILYNKKYIFNSKKIIILGQSHGAYLSYLCNAIAPKLFSLIIDNSAWVFPQYLNFNRCVLKKINNTIVNINYDYLAKNIVDDFEIFDLKIIYSQFENQCKIVCYHGSEDNLISCKEKREFCKDINKCIYNEITEKQLDNEKFKSTSHGLNADLIELFKHTIDTYGNNFEKATELDIDEKIALKTSKYCYNIDYSNIIPNIYRIKV